MCASSYPYVHVASSKATVARAPTETRAFRTVARVTDASNGTSTVTFGHRTTHSNAPRETHASDAVDSSPIDCDNSRIASSASKNSSASSYALSSTRSRASSYTLEKRFDDTKSRMNDRLGCECVAFDVLTLDSLDVPPRYRSMNSASVAVVAADADATTSSNSTSTRVKSLDISIVPLTSRTTISDVEHPTPVEILRALNPSNLAPFPCVYSTDAARSKNFPAPDASCTTTVTSLARPRSPLISARTTRRITLELSDSLSSPSSSSSSSSSSPPAPSNRATTATSSTSNQHESLPIASHGIRPVIFPHRIDTNLAPHLPSARPAYADTASASNSTSRSVAAPTSSSSSKRTLVSVSPSRRFTTRPNERSSAYAHARRIARVAFESSSSSSFLGR